MGKKITVEIEYYGTVVDFEGERESYSVEARYAQAEDQKPEEFEQAVAEQGYRMLDGITVKGFIGHNTEKNQFFIIKPHDIVSATATISDTIDTK
jgi:hypothetical protein